MRVLNVNAMLDAATGGGCAERTFQLSRAFAAAGMETAVLTLDVGITEARRAALGEVELIALPCIQRRFLVPRDRHGDALLAAFRADIVHIMGHWTPLNALAYRAAVRARTPHVVNPAGGLPVDGRSRLLKHAFNALVGKKLIRSASAHVAITAAEAPQFEAYGVDARNVTVIPNGVDPAEFAYFDIAGFRAQHGLADAPYVLFVGRLAGIKGPDLLLQAFAKLPPKLAHHHLVFAGPDEGLGTSLREFAAKNGLTARVHFTDKVSGVEKASAYRGAALLVVPSRREAMSIVALEAGACGKPALITDQCGFDEIEKLGGGAVVPASADGLAAGLETLLSQPDALAAMGTAFEAAVRAHYAWQAAALRYRELFASIAR